MPTLFKDIPPLTANQLIRFWRRVEKRPDGIWNWTGTKSRRGYGWVTLNKSRYKVHRVSWFLAYGPIPPGMVIMHKNPVTPELCDVNPANLHPGTVADNNWDTYVHGPRGRVGRKYCLTCRQALPFGLVLGVACKRP